MTCIVKEKNAIFEVLLQYQEPFPSLGASRSEGEA